MIDSQNLTKLIKFHPSIPKRLISREGGCLEFKEAFNWSSKDKYGKSIASFANNRGGFLVFGVGNNPRNLVGLRNKNFESLDEAKISEYLNSVFSPEIIWEKLMYKFKGKRLGVIFVQENLDKPVICVKNDGVLKEAEMYYRYNGRSEKIKYPELIKIISTIREMEKKSWMDHIKKISKIGPRNTAILDVVRGQIKGIGGTLLIDNKLVPKLNFIRQGQLNKKKGTPVLKLIGDVKGVPVSGYKVRKISEEKYFRYSFTDLSKKLGISPYILICLFWKFPKLKKDENYCHRFMITPGNRPIKYNRRTLMFLNRKLKTIDVEKLKKKYRDHLKRQRAKR